MNYDQTKYPMIWKRTSSTGYCFTAHIPCRMIRKLGKKIEIAASLIGGKERIHRVDPKSLKHDPCSCFSECKAIDKLDAPKYVAIAHDTGRIAMAEVVSFGEPSSGMIDLVFLMSPPGHASFGLSSENHAWSLNTGRRPMIFNDTWKITVTDLENLRRQALDLQRLKVTGQ